MPRTKITLRRSQLPRPPRKFLATKSASKSYSNGSSGGGGGGKRSHPLIKLDIVRKKKTKTQKRKRPVVSMF